MDYGTARQQWKSILGGGVNYRGNKVITRVQPNASALQLLAANPQRIQCMIQNISGAHDCYLGNDNTVSSTTGILLANGAAIFIDNFSIDAWWAIGSGGAADLRIIEIS